MQHGAKKWLNTAINLQIYNPGEQGCCSLGHVLAYGQTWVKGPFTCQSRQTGLTCRRKDGRGFSLSRAAVRLF
jgi:hypothetical protein